MTAPRSDDDTLPGILFVVDHLRHPHAGSEGQLLRLVGELVARGVPCHLLVLKTSAYLEQEGFPCPWSSLERSRISSPRTWLAMWLAGRTMRRRGFRIAHTFLNDASVLAPPMLALSGIRTVISRRDMGFWYSRSYLALLRVTRRWVAACVTNSRAVAEHTHTMERIPRERLHVIHNGFVMDEPAPSEPGVPWTQGSGRWTVGLVANIRPIKRIQDLVQAVALLKDTETRVDAVIIGDGDSSDLQRLAQSLGVADRVHFAGPRADVRACLSRLDAGVLCSESEGFSNAVVEYMLAGLPTVCTRAGGNPEAIRHGETGLLYDVGDVSGLAGHLQWLTAHPGESVAMGRRARGEAVRRFSVERMVEEHLALYRHLAPEVARPC